MITAEQAYNSTVIIESQGMKWEPDEQTQQKLEAIIKDAISIGNFYCFFEYHQDCKAQAYFRQWLKSLGYNVVLMSHEVIGIYPSIRICVYRIMWRKDDSD